MHTTDTVAGLSCLPSPEQLPNDIGILKSMLIELVASLRREQRDKQALQHRLQLLLQRLYGPRGERFNPNQLLLFAELAELGEGQPSPPADLGTPAEKKKKRRCRPHGRRRLPDNLPHETKHHELPAAARICRGCGQQRIDIGSDKSEQLEYRPASLIVVEHFVHKYLCRGCSQPPRLPTAPLLQQDQEPEQPAGPSLQQNQEPEQLSGCEPSALPALAPAGDPRQPMEPTQPPTPADPSANNPEPEAATAPAAPAPPVALLGVVIAAPKPLMPIPKGLPGPGLLAHLIVSKHVDHLPLHRLERVYERQGVVLPRSTTCDWLAAASQLLQPLYDVIVALVLQSRVLHTDDTPVKMKQPSHHLGTARLWAYLGDAAHPYNVFDFTVNRKRDGPQTFLAGYAGYLQADAFSGYDHLYLPSPVDGLARIIECACNAHARRKFYEARDTDVVRSHTALGYYRALYALERGAASNHFDDGQRLRMRQDFSVPLLNDFKKWLDQERGVVLPKSPMAEAIGYALNNWTALVRYTEAGFLAIDNNVAEREMKRIAIGRKNWLFVGSEKGGHTAAVHFSFTSTCQRLGVEPWAYLQDVLSRLPTTPPAELPDLLPDRWEATRRTKAAAAATSPATPAADAPS